MSNPRNPEKLSRWTQIIVRKIYIIRTFYDAHFGFSFNKYFLSIMKENSFFKLVISRELKAE